MSSRRPARGRGGTSGARAPAPLSDREIEQLQALLDAVPPPLDPLDVSSLDGFLCGVLVQPEPVPRERWLAFVSDTDGRALPPGHDAARLHTLVARREAELRRAIAARAWFDPWVFELAPDSRAARPRDAGDAPAGREPESAAVYPWVAGMTVALETFPALLQRGGPALHEPLALLYRHLDPGDLDAAEELLAEIAASEPPSDLAEAVEDLVRATLLLADAAAAPRGQG